MQAFVHSKTHGFKKDAAHRVFVLVTLGLLLYLQSFCATIKPSLKNSAQQPYWSHFHFSLTSYNSCQIDYSSIITLVLQVLETLHYK